MGLQKHIEAALAASYDFARGKLGRGRIVQPNEAAEGGGFFLGTALPFGRSDLAAGTPVWLSERQLSKHVALYGGSGAGKSTLLRRLRLHYYRMGYAVLDIDFSGDGTDAECASLCALGDDAPETALIDLRQRDFVAGLNLLGGPGSPHARASSFVGALGSEADVPLGVRVKYNAFAGSVALAELGFCVTEFRALFSTEPGFRRHVLSALRDESARAALEEFDRLDPATQRTHWMELSNKLSNFTAIPDLRLMVGQAGFPDFGKLLDQPSRATLVALGAARQPAAVVAAKVLLSALERHVMARADLPEERRQPVRLIIDEASQVAGFGLESLLYQGRRMRASLCTALQQTTQVEPPLRNALRANCSTQIFFAAGGLEASELAGEIACGLTREEVRETLIGLKVGTALVVRRGEPAVMVRMPDSPVPKVVDADMAALRASALAETGVPRERAEAAMRERAEWIASLSPDTTEARVVSVKRPMGRESADA